MSVPRPRNSYVVPCHETVSRRGWLHQATAGFGSLAVASLLHPQASASADREPNASPLQVVPSHHRPTAKRVIFLFMHGGPSQVDTFDYKPQLERDHDKPVPFAKPRVVGVRTGNLLRSPWKFRPRGESGIPVSEVFPLLGDQVDRLCVINSMHCSNPRHGSALLELHTGSDTFIRPSMGSWIAYGLGTENQNLPSFITICPTLTHGGVNAWSSAFLPAHYQGTPLGFVGTPAENAKVHYIANRDTSRTVQRAELDLLHGMNSAHRAAAGPDAELDSRIESYELAFRMQNAVPSLQDLSRETAATRRLYGLDDETTRDFGTQCLLARRFAEAGVRFIQCTHSYKWDQHSGLEQVAKNAAEIDRPISGLLVDLEQRGLLEDTLVVWGGEFGRTPTSEGGNGRDHNSVGYTMWLAGGGIRGGLRYGSTDEYGYFAAQDKVHVHDLHATILHALGLDHLRLSYRYAGRDFRLTDVHGEVVHAIFS